MNNKFKLSWNIIANNKNDSGNLRDPSWSDISKCLAKLEKSNGVLSLYLLNAPDIGPQFLQVRKTAENSIIAMEECDDDGSFVRSYSDKSSPEGSIEILGDIWPLCEVCTDFNIVIRAFKDFFDTGNTSYEVLN